MSKAKLRTRLGWYRKPDICQHAATEIWSKKDIQTQTSRCRGRKGLINLWCEEYGIPNGSDARPGLYKPLLLAPFWHRFSRLNPLISLSACFQRQPLCSSFSGLHDAHLPVGQPTPQANFCLPSEGQSTFRVNSILALVSRFCHSLEVVTVIAGATFNLTLSSSQHRHGGIRLL
ncbi:unnamed protein product [Protopolystoma xenopodis]|uniref:Uncharacterized protein n=1 Tax=Protopolystoma xenopodis TaxID=117903 RepID=A0A448X200_9PLAT|nr:unnamed protein product [Protopolystoma xenopodis]